MLALLLAAWLQAPLAYLFFSPNTGPVMSAAAARAALAARPEKNAVAVADRAACALASAARVSPALGIYADGFENSVVVAAPLAAAQAGFAAAVLGRFERQQWVLWFAPGPGGPDRLFRLTLPGAAAGAVAPLRARGLAPATALGRELLIVAPAGRSPQVAALAAVLHAGFQAVPGRSHPLAAGDYGRVIAAAPGRAAAALHLAAWPALLTRTCSTP